jgi:hypothetical protein
MVGSVRKVHALRGSWQVYRDETLQPVRDGDGGEAPYFGYLRVRR